MKVEAIQRMDPLKKGPQKKIKGMDMEFCANCGKPIIFSAFMPRSSYTYKYSEKGKIRYCCIYACLRIKQNKKVSS